MDRDQRPGGRSCSPAPVVQRTGSGKSAVHLRRDRAAAIPRRGPAGHRLAASGAHAQPDRGRGASRESGPAPSTRSISSSGMRSTRKVAAGQVDVLLVSPERLNNPGFRDMVLPELIASAGLLVVDEAHRASPTRKLRLQARLPQASDAAGRPAAGCARAGRPRRPRMSESAATSPSSLVKATTARTRSCGAAWTATACVWPSSRCPPPSSAWAGWPTISPSCRAPASSTR